MRLRRRSFVTALAAVTTPVLAACTTRGIPSPMRSPQSPSPIPECVDLSREDFRAGSNPCDGSGGAEAGGGADGDMRQLLWFGPISTHDAVVVAWYLNVLVEWSLSDGTALRALAPRRASERSYALVGGAVVTPTCDGLLAVHRDGCLTSTIRPNAAVAQLAGVDDASFLTLGADGTLRRLDLEGNVLAKAAVESSLGGTFLAVDRATRMASVSSGTAASLLDATTLKLRKQVGSLPGSRVGWKPMSNGQLAGLGDALYRHDVASGSTERFALESEAVLAVGPNGTIAAVGGVDWTVLPRGGRPLSGQRPPRVLDGNPRNNRCRRHPHRPRRSPRYDRDRPRHRRHPRHLQGTVDTSPR